MAKFTKTVDINGVIEVDVYYGGRAYINLRQFGLVGLQAGEYEFEITATRKESKQVVAAEALTAFINSYLGDNEEKVRVQTVQEKLNELGLEVKDINA